MSSKVQNYRFSNLMGSVYSKGNLQFSPDGFTLISPVGNRISMYALKDNISKTLPIEGTTNFTSISLSPNGFLLIAGNEIGEVYVISLISETILHVLKLGGYIQLVKYSRDGSMFAVAKSDVVLVYSAPSKKPVLNPFNMLRTISDVRNIGDIDWSFDNKLMSCYSMNGLIHIYPMASYVNFKAVTLSVNSGGVLRSFFRANDYNIYSVESQGVLRVWETSNPSDFIIDGSTLPKESLSPIRYKQTQKFFYADLFEKGKRRPDVSSAEFNRSRELLIAGFEGGIFHMHEMPDFNLIQSIQVSNSSISTICINSSAEWIAFGFHTMGQLMVWEWQSESYIMKQQGHFDIIECFEFSPNNNCIATGGVDGKIKVWNTVSSFCFKTFGDHTGAITGLVFTQKGKAIVSCSLDGTVRGFDLTRYRNFRTFTTPRPVQFSCVAVDFAGALVVAGGRDVFEIFLWCMQSGRLLEIFSGHEGAISSVVFSPTALSSSFVSTSLDKTARIWYSIENCGACETIQLGSEGTCLAFSPSGQLVAVGCLNATITFFDLEGHDKGSINGGLYLHTATLTSNATKHNQTNNLRGKEFRTLCFSPDGKLLLAAGPNKIICMFDVEHQHLLKAYTITRNFSLNGIEGFIHQNKMSEFGNMDLVEDRDDASNQLPLPGVRKGDMASRLYRNEIRVTAVRFSPDGNSWGAATTEGLLMYTAKNFTMFDPIWADEEVTPQGIETALAQKKFDHALMMALRLNIPDIIKSVLSQIDCKTVMLLVKDFPFKYVKFLLRFLADEIPKTVDLGLYLFWISNIFKEHLWIITSASNIIPILNAIRQNMSNVNKNTLTLLQHNCASLDLILRRLTSANIEEVEPSDSDSADELLMQEVLGPTKRRKTK